MPTLRSALADYFVANGFPADGGYAATWVPLDFGPLRLYLYNSAARKRAVPIHDLHHLLTGYATTPSGEAEVAAWEFGAGTWPCWFATVINLPALGYGVLLWPGRMWAAFRRGRRMTSLYRQVPLGAEGGLEAWLDLEVEEARTLLPGARRSAALDGVVFAGFFGCRIRCAAVADGCGRVGRSCGHHVVVPRGSGPDRGVELARAGLELDRRRGSRCRGPHRLTPAHP